MNIFAYRSFPPEMFRINYPRSRPYWVTPTVSGRSAVRRYVPDLSSLPCIHSFSVEFYTIIFFWIHYRIRLIKCFVKFLVCDISGEFHFCRFRKWITRLYFQTNILKHIQVLLMLSLIVDNFMNLYKNEIHCIYLPIYHCDIIGITS